MRGMDIFQKPYYREISTMRGRPMRGLPVVHRTEESNAFYTNHTNKKIWRKLCDK